MERIRTIVLGLTLGAVLCGCSEQEPGITDEQFAGVLVALRDAARARTPAEFEARRDSILDEAGISREDLYGFVRRTTRDPRRMSAAWDSAAARAVRPDSAAGEPDEPEPGPIGAERAPVDGVDAAPARRDPIERGRVRRGRLDRMHDSGIADTGSLQEEPPDPDRGP